VVDYATAVKDRYLPLQPAGAAAHKFSRMNNHDEVDRLTAQSREHRAALALDAYPVDDSPDRAHGHADSLSDSARARAPGSRLTLSALVHGSAHGTGNPRRPHPDSVPFDAAAVEQAAHEHSVRELSPFRPRPSPSTPAGRDPSPAAAAASSPTDARLRPEAELARPERPPVAGPSAPASPDAAEQPAKARPRFQGLSFDGPNAAALLRDRDAVRGPRGMARRPASASRDRAGDAGNTGVRARPRPDTSVMHVALPGADADADEAGPDADMSAELSRQPAANRRVARGRTASVTPRSTPAKQPLGRRPAGSRGDGQFRGYEEPGFIDLPTRSLRPRQGSAPRGPVAVHGEEDLMAAGTLAEELDPALDASHDHSLGFGGRYYVPSSLPPTPAFKQHKVVNK
jgi:hypothetical protein